MANLYRAPSGVWRIRFRFSGRQYYRSLDTSDGKQALRIKDQVEETLDLLKRGRISLPEVVTADEAGMFIISGGRIAEEPAASATGKTLKEATLCSTIVLQCKGSGQESTKDSRRIDVSPFVARCRRRDSNSHEVYPH